MAENQGEVKRAASEMRDTFKRYGGKISSILGGVTVENYNDLREMKARTTIASTVKRLKVESVSWVRREIPKFYEMGAAQVAPKLKRIHIENFHQSRTKGERHRDIERQTTHASLYILKAAESINVMASRYLEAVGSAARKLDSAPAQLQAFDKVIRNTAMDIINKGYEEADSLGVIKRELLDFFRWALEDEDFIEVGGRLYQMDAYAEMLARTELVKSMAQATTDECKDWGDDLVMVDRHDNPCPECADLELQIFSISGSDAEYEPLPEWPPHPNCSHVLMPTSREEISFGFNENYAPSEVSQ